MLKSFGDFYSKNMVAKKEVKSFPQVDYLKIGKASDLSNSKERAIYRFFEILPGGLCWTLLFFVVFFSWKKPVWVAIFIIFFDLYWLFRTAYFSFHLRGGYKKMKEYQKIDWIEKLNEIDIASVTRAQRRVEKNECSSSTRAQRRGGFAELRSSLAPRFAWADEAPASATRLNIKSWQDIYHLIILPIYKEPLEIVRESFKSLENSDWSKEKMIVVLGGEERAKKTAKKVAEEIEKEFGNKFFKFLITWHPTNLPGEIPGHGSNDAWATKQVKKLIIDPLKLPYQNIIVSFFDADTCVFPKYFSCLSWHYLTAEKPTRTSYQPIPLYLNNIWQAPPFSRVFAFSSTFWHTMNQERQEKLITFSSHSMSFLALFEVGFKQTNVVSDDSRIFWQCFLKYNGDYRVKPLYYPISMDANTAKNIFKTAVNIYKQQRRWAYGVGEIPYFLFGFLKNKKIKLSKKISLGFELIEGHLSWATAPILIFCLGWLPLVFGGTEFSQTLISYNLPKITSRILTISMTGLIISAYLSLLLLPPRLPAGRRFKYLMFAFSWILVPVVTVFFTALPALDAQTRWMLGKYMGFWPTEKIRK